MAELFMLENERAKMAAPIQYEKLIQNFDLSIVERAAAVHDNYMVQGGKSRDKYMQRLALEFKDEGLDRSSLDLLDGYLEHRRFYRAKTKALLRDYERERRDLRERTVRLIEEEVAETKERILRDLEQLRVESKKELKQAKLEDKRREFARKMRVIEEIEEEKKRHERELQERKDDMARARHLETKAIAM